MDKSETIGALAAALAKAQGQMRNARKDVTNTFFRNRYADLSAIIEAIKEPLAANELAYVQTTDVLEGHVVVETVLLHSSGEWISGRLSLRPVKDDPQGIGSAVSYGRRYGLQAIVGIAAEDEDDDGNAAAGHQPKAKLEVVVPRPPDNSPDSGLVAPRPAAALAGASTEAQRTAIYTIAKKEHGRSEQDVHEACRALYGVASTKDLTKAQASDLIEQLKAGWPAVSNAGAAPEPGLAFAGGEDKERAALIDRIGKLREQLAISPHEFNLELKDWTEKREIATWMYAEKPVLQKLLGKMEQRLAEWKAKQGKAGA